MLYRLIGGAYTARRLVAYFLSSLSVPILDGVTHDIGSLRGSIHGYLACGCLDEVCTCCHSQDAGFVDVLCGLQRACLEDHLEVCIANSGFDLGDLVIYLLVVAFEELTNRDDDVYLCSAGCYSHSCLCHFHLNEGLRSRETSCYGSDADRLGQYLAGCFDQSRIYAHSCYVGHAREVSVKVVHFLSHRCHFLGGVVTIEGGQIDLMETLHPHFACVVLCCMFCQYVGGILLN